MVDTDAKKLKYYLRGLPPNIRTLVRASRPETFQAAVDSAQSTYADLESPEVTAVVVKKEEAEKKSFVPAKRAGGPSWNPSAKKTKTEDRKPCTTCGKVHWGKCQPGMKSKECSKCGKLHSGECRVGSGGCYKCGKPGHLALDCKVKPTCFNCGQVGHMSRECTNAKKMEAGSSKPNTRAFALTADQAKRDPDVVSGLGIGIC